jgi:hypothetical protein
MSKTHLNSGEDYNKKTYFNIISGIIFLLLFQTNTSAFNVGDTISVIAIINVRTGPGTDNPEITDPDYEGYAPQGIIGEIIGGPVNANGYIWWNIDYGNGLYSGWSIENGIQIVAAIPILKWPLQGNINDRTIIIGFGANWVWGECPTGVYKKHVALDISGTVSESVYAPEAGIVHIGQDSSHPEWANYVVIVHSGFTTVCWHINPTVQEGQNVTKGQIIGNIANISPYQIHLHFGVRASNYQTGLSQVGALPQGDCGGYPGFPEYFINPAILEYGTSGQDMNPPVVNSFSVSPSSVTVGNSFTINYSVSDTGGSGLKQAELWRANDSGGSPVGWTEIISQRTFLSGNGPYNGSFTDTSSSTGTYWYGMHVVDNAGNWNDEQNSNTSGLPGDYGPIMVTVNSPLSFTYNFAGGLNLISFPFTPKVGVSQKFADIFQSLGTDLFPYVFYLNEDETIGFASIDSVDAVAKKGYFLFLENARSCTVSGESVDTAITLHSGLNIVGVTDYVVPENNSNVFPTAFYVDSSGAVQITSIFQNGLEPGIGYYIFSDADDVVLVPGGRGTTLQQREKQSKTALESSLIQKDIKEFSSTSVGTDFSCQIAATQVNAGASPVILNFGMKPEATDGYDDGIDAICDLPMPGNMTAKFNESFGLKNSYKTPSDFKTWPILVRSESPDTGPINTNPVVISWTIPQQGTIDPDASFELLDSVGNVLISDMRTTTQISFLVDAPNTERRYTIRATLVTPPQSGMVHFISSSYSVSESNGSVTIFVGRSGGSDGAASVNYETSDDTATSGSDYTAVSGTLNWADGDDTDKTISVPLINDSAHEVSETFTVTLTEASGATLGSPSQTMITINDDDQQAGIARTTTTLNVSDSSIIYGHSGTFTATVAVVPPDSGTPTGGTVTFLDGNTVIGSSTLIDGTAIFTTTSLKAGLHFITARYSGDGLNFAASSTIVGPNSIINTIAGNGSSGFSGDNGLATNAMLNSPSPVAIDANGHLFIADEGNNRVREVDLSTNIIFTFAGNGTSGYSGDGGQANMASFRIPACVAVDTNNNLFISDNGNHRIRKVNLSTGIITTAVGNGTRGFSGDGGQATLAQLSIPTGIAIDPQGNLFISDQGNNRIREVNLLTGIISTVAGNGVQGYSGDNGQATLASLFSPSAVARDTNGNLLIADFSNYRIRRVNLSTGIITTVAGNGTYGYTGDNGLATEASLTGPSGVAVDTSGNILIADWEYNRIREVNHSTHIITTLVGGGVGGLGDDGPANLARLNSPVGVAFDASGNLFIGDQGNNLVRRVSAGVTVNVMSQMTVDLNNDGIPDFYDFSNFATNWQNISCSLPDWCNGSDFDKNGIVDIHDLRTFAEFWLWSVADVDIDDDVDFVDYAILGNHWMYQNCSAPNWCNGNDFDKSGKVDILDLFEFTDSWLSGF